MAITREADGSPDLDVLPTTSQREPIQPQAAAELAQELTLVARAMFAQLLPDAGSYALSGVPVAGGPAPMSMDAASGVAFEQVAHHHTAPAPAQAPLPVGEAVPHCVAEPSYEQLAVPLPAPEPGPDLHVPAAVSATSVPVETPSVPVPQLEVPGLEPAGTVQAVAVPATESFEAPALDVPSLGVPGEPDPAAHVESLPVPAPEASSKSSHRPDRSLTMLAEIGFLDE
ncbi:MAG TPA: hypothetical protein VER39_11650 [Nocardioidaceae bacterium]|nr:hypothetical protein [Nocardioidaceae bacterium]